MSALPPLQTYDDLRALEAVPLADRDLARTTYDLLDRAARAWPDGEAVAVLPDPSDVDRAMTWTFAELRQQVDAVAAVLTGAGVGRTDPVSLISPNTGLLLAATLAAEAVAIAAPVNPAFDTDRIGHLLRTTGSRVAVVAGPELDPDLWKRMVDAAADLGLVALLALRPDGATGPAPRLEQRPGVRIAHLEDLLRAVAAEPLPAGRRPRPDDVAAYFHTGGTTGDPKVAVHTHANQAVTAWTIAVAGGLGGGASVLAGLPLFHVNAVLVTTLAPLVSGTRGVWPGPHGYRDPALYGAFWRIVERYRPSTMSAVPTVYAVLATIPVEADISSLTNPVVGAAPLPDAVRAAFRERTGLELAEGYGLTEATCASTATPPGQGRAGTVGRRLPYQRLRVVRYDGAGTPVELPRGEVGEVEISGPAVFAGYLRPGPDGPVPVPDGHVVDGWLRTGDLGALDDQDHLSLTGRTKDLIIRGGHNLDPRVIEDALLAHRDVTAAAAVGRPDAHAGEVPVAFVSLAPGAAVTPEDLLAWSATHVDEPAARPRLVTVLPELPTTSVGKPFKPELRELAAIAAATELLAGSGFADVAVTAAHRDGRLTVAVAGPAATAAARALSGLPVAVAVAVAVEEGTA